MEGKDLYSAIARSPPTRVVWIEIDLLAKYKDLQGSPPTRVVWIEIYYIRDWLD